MNRRLKTLKHQDASRFVVSLMLFGVIFLVLMVSQRTGETSASPPCPYNTCTSGQTCGQWYNDDAGSLCCVTACGAEHRGTNLDPSFPRVAMQRPGEPQKDMVNCQASGPSDGATPYIHAKYDLVAFTGFSDGCTIPSFINLQGYPYYANAKEFAQEIETYSPETIVLGKAGYSPMHIRPWNTSS